MCKGSLTSQWLARLVQISTFEEQRLTDDMRRLDSPLQRSAVRLQTSNRHKVPLLASGQVDLSQWEVKRRRKP